MPLLLDLKLIRSVLNKQTGDTTGKEPSCQCRRHEMQVWFLGWEDCLQGHGNPLQYSGLENPMDRGAWWAIVHRVTKRWTWLKQLSTHANKHNWFTLFLLCFTLLSSKKCLLCNLYFVIVLVIKSCLTLLQPNDCSPPGSQARTVEWVAISFSRESAWPTDWVGVSCIGRQILYHWATGPHISQTYNKLFKELTESLPLSILYSVPVQSHL